MKSEKATPQPKTRKTLNNKNHVRFNYPYALIFIDAPNQCYIYRQQINKLNIGRTRRSGLNPRGNRGRRGLQ